MSSIIISGQVVRPEFDDVKHLYTVGGVRVPSVSRILRPLTTAVYGEIDRETLRRAADFGTAVHACTELLDLDELDEDSVIPEWSPYLDAYKRWKTATRPAILQIEDRLGCGKYAGTLDRICVINGERWVIDIKTTSSIHPHVGVQLAAYVALAEGFYGGTYRRAALQLRGDGSFKVTEFSSLNDETCFNALLGIYHWQTQ